jgi:hypothetical protein
LETHRDAEYHELANGVACCGVRFAGGVADPAPALALAEKAVKSPFVQRHEGVFVDRKGQPQKPAYVTTLGAALYRADSFQDSVLRLDEAMKAAGREEGTAQTWLFLAMAHHRLGHADEAKRWLDKAGKWIDENTKEKPKDGAAGPSLSWDQGLELKLIRQEAEELITGKKAK